MTHKNTLQHRKSQHNWYMKNRERLIPIAVERKRDSRNQDQQWFKELKSTLFCMKCGENHVSCLDFHHRDPNVKECGIASRIGKWSRKRILAEINKCDVLCSNCHRKEHWVDEN